MTDERLKIWIDLGKWAVVSVGLVIMTKIIDTGFKDREVGIKEINEYDKYVSLVTDNNKISERRLLAQYFAHVTPSKTLQKGWQSYFNTIDEEYQALVEEKKQIKERLALLNEAENFTASSPDFLQLQSEIKDIEEELTPTFKKEKTINDFEAAINWEKKGFQNLINKNLDQAISAFENSENSYNSFHQVYEIASYLKQKRKSGETIDDRFWQIIYKEILANFSWKMPNDAKQKMEGLIE